MLDAARALFLGGDGERMSEFHLIDLVSQRDAVKAHLKGKSREEIIVWLTLRGTLTPLPKVGHPGEHVFRFESPTGREALFFFDGSELVFVGNHNTFT